MDNQSTVTTLEASPSKRYELPVSEQVIKAVADAKDTSALDLHPPLYTVIDPEALDDLVTSMDARDQPAGCVSFTYCDHEVSIFGDGTVSVAALDRE